MEVLVRNRKYKNLFDRSFLLEDRCRFLSNFSLATAEVELPGEYLVPKVGIYFVPTHLMILYHVCIQPMPYYVRIARFMPRVEIVQKHDSTVRRLYIQGHNGKVSTLSSCLLFLSLFSPPLLSCQFFL